jgi:uroporphyrinogen decarboxylase
MANAHLEFYRRSHGDILKVMNDNPYQLVGVSRIDQPSDWRRLRPEPRYSPGRRQYLDGLKQILDAVGHEVPVIMTVFNPFATANDNRAGILDFSDASFAGITHDLRTDPKSTLVGLRVVAESLAEFSRACIEAGAMGVFFSANGGERDRFHDDEFESWVMATDRMVLDAARDAGAQCNVLHVCGARQRLSAYRDYPAQIANWAHELDNPSLLEGRRMLGRTILGGLDAQGPLTRGSRGEVEEEVRQVLASAPAPAFILGAGCAVQGDVSPDLFAWVREIGARLS